MRMGRSQPVPRTRVLLLTADKAFEQAVRAAFGSNQALDLQILPRAVSAVDGGVNIDGASVVLVDLELQDSEVQALERLVTRLGNRVPVVVVAQTFDGALARRLLQMRVADMLVKPVQPAELVRTCTRAATSPATSTPETTEAEIYTFLPAVGGSGVTTLAIQTALLLLGSGARGQSSTCLVDLNFQHGACADYLDLAPRLDLNEIEPSPERLDRQLLEVMLSYHASGLAVIAAPNRPAEMRSFDPDVVTRLLDLAASNFTYVVIDMPRTWFSWTDSVLLGSNKLFVVSEMTVPGLRHGKQLVEAIRERLEDKVTPQVIVNRFEQPLFGSGLRLADIEQALGDAFAGVVPNDYRLVREAIDRGVPLDEVKKGNKISVQLKKLMVPPPAYKTAGPAAPAPKGRKIALSWARG
jgi:pilus assembly protein CpaE